MRGVRTGHVVLGGLAAGVIINISETILNLVVLGDQMTAFMARLNLPPVTGAAMGTFAVLGFALGIGITWLYAGIRTRYGPGVATALRAGAAVYFFVVVPVNAFMARMRRGEAPPENLEFKLVDSTGANVCNCTVTRVC